MISYQVNCISCRVDFTVVEGTKEYRKFKENFRGKQMCSSCKTKIEMSAQKMSGFNPHVIESFMSKKGL